MPGPALCDFEGASYLLLGPNVAPLVYYSHLPVAVIAFLLGTYVLSRDWRSLSNQLLFVITLAFSSWVFMDSVFWATNRSDVIMLTWSGTVMVEPLVHLAGLYLLYVLIHKGDLPFIAKLVLFLSYLPLLIFGPTSLNLSGFDMASCLAEEGVIARYYSYGLEIVAMLAVLIFAVVRFDAAKDWDRRREILTYSIGIFLLMFAFSWGNIIGSFTEDWQIAQYGLFGMPVFIGFLLYSVVKYRTFNIKLIGAVALVLALCALTFALLFVQDVQVFRGVAFITFVLAVTFGAMLIRGVKREVSLREELEVANQQQETLLHFISHEVKGYLTKNEAAFAAVSAGDFGATTPELAEMSKAALKDTRKGVATVMDILDASNLKKGTVAYNKQPFDLVKAVDEIVHDLSDVAQKKGLELSFHKPVTGAFIIEGDEDKIRRHVLRNVIDNSIKYTPHGSVKVEIIHTARAVRVIVTDTGVGITHDDMGHLFTEGGHGKDAIKVNVDSTGYGLYIAKQITEAHGGTIHAESEGAGKGSRFIIEFPTSV